MSIEYAACNSCGTPNVPNVESGSMHQEWEYEVVEIGENLKGTLNDLGKDGWSLVATTPAFIFKRPKRSEEKLKGRVGFTVG